MENSKQESQQMKESPLVVNSEELFRGRREIFIRHCDGQYRLLITKAGKLILNK